jgi:hypothetical protein
MKTNLRFNLLGIVILLYTAQIFAQTATRDVVYLKNGSVIHGIIIETVPDSTIKIQTADGNIFVINFSEIEKYGKESVPEIKPVNAPPISAADSPSSFSIFGGAAFSMGDFASTDINNTNSCFAKTGFAAGVQFVTGGQVGFLISALYASNSFDPSQALTEINAWTAGSQGARSASISSGHWQSILALVGLKIGTASTSGINFFVAPLIGVDFGKLPDISLTIADNNYSYPGYNISGSAAMQSSSATALAYGGMAEIDFGHITLGARFITCKPKFSISGNATATMTSTIPPYSSSSETESITDPNTEERTITMIIVCLGVAF